MKTTHSLHSADTWPATHAELIKESTLPAFRVHRDDGTNYVTSMAHGVTLADAKEYFIGNVQYADIAETVKRTVISVTDAETLHPSGEDVRENLDGFPSSRGLLAHLETVRVFAPIAYFNYCKLKARAMDARREGEIGLAFSLESRCDALYSDIPSDWQW